MSVNLCPPTNNRQFIDQGLAMTRYDKTRAKDATLPVASFFER